MFVLLYKEMLLNINNLDFSLSSVVSSLLQEFEDVFSKDGPSGLPPEETKELQCQVEKNSCSILFPYSCTIKYLFWRVSALQVV